MDVNSQAAVLFVGVLVSIALPATLAACLWGLCPPPGKLCHADDDNDGPREPWCITLACHWMWRRFCCRSCSRITSVRDWFEEDLRKMDAALLDEEQKKKSVAETENENDSF